MTPASARIGGLLGASLVLLTVAACWSGARGSPTPVATAQAVALRTAAAKPQGCMDALLGGRLAKHDQTGLGVTAADGRQTPVEWQFRYSARLVDGRIAVMDETGKIVAREGDAITVGGGLGNQLWYACGPVTVTRIAN